LKLAAHAPAVSDPLFFPALVLDAVLTGAKGMNLWSSFRVPPPQRSSRLYRALVDTGLASAVNGSLLPTEQPFLYTVSATATTGVTLERVEANVVTELDRVAREGITPAELTKAKAQLAARFVFDNDSVTNVAHQIGYFETIAGGDVFESFRPRIAAVTIEEVAEAARTILTESNRTVGWFDPLPVDAVDDVA
jgi:zinc protease